MLSLSNQNKKQMSNSISQVNTKFFDNGNNGHI